MEFFLRKNGIKNEKNMGARRTIYILLPHFQRLPCSCTLVLTLCLHSPLMPLTSQLVLSLSSSLTIPGNHWLFKVISYGHQNANTALSTINCWHCIWQCGISVFCLRVALSLPTQTTSLYHSLSPRSRILGHQDKSSIWLSSPNSLCKFDILLARTTAWLMHFHILRLTPYVLRLVLIFPPWRPRSASTQI